MASSAQTVRIAATQSRVRRPSIPSSMYRPSLGGTFAFLGYAVLLFVIPATLLRLIVTVVDSLLLRIVLMAPLILLAGFGLNLMGFVGHEGMHLSLFRNKYASAITGLFFASAVTTYYELGFAMQHWNHHRYTNQASDYDITMVAHLKTWWQRLLFARGIYNWAYFKTTLRTALGQPNPFPYKMPFREETLRGLALLNFAFSLMWIALYVTISIVDPLVGIFSILLPMASILLISSCQPFIDHAGTGDDIFRNAWSRTSPLMTALYFGANYHLEHHLYPGVPCYRLGRIHRLLKSNGAYQRESPPIESRFFGAYRKLAAPYEPGTDRDFDPLVKASP